MKTRTLPPRRLYTSHKRCNQCKKTKLISEFGNRSGEQKTMHKAFCKKCMTNRSKKWVDKNRKHYQLYQALYQQKYRLLHK